MPDRTPHESSSLQHQGQELLDLMENHVEPAIRRVVRSKLSATLLSADEHPENQDALDLVSEIRTVTLRALRQKDGANDVENVVSYASRIAINVCNQYFRAKYPRFFRIKNGVRYILTHDSRFALWKPEDGLWLCGKMEWAGQSASSRMADLAKMLRSNVDLPAISPYNFRLLDLVAKAIALLDGPVPSNVIVKAIYELLEIDESTEEFNDDFSACEHWDHILERLEQKQQLEAIWNGLSELPLRHRTSVLLNLRNERGDSVIELFPLMRIVSVRQIAEVLAIPVEIFVRIWGELPWDDNRIAKHLGITRQQVINLRQSARRKLKRRLAGS